MPMTPLPFQLVESTSKRLSNENNHDCLIYCLFITFLFNSQKYLKQNLNVDKYRTIYT